MIRTLASAAALLSLSSCFTYNDRGVLMAFVPVMDNYTCDVLITENIVDSDPPFSYYGGTSPWVYSYEVVASDQVTFFQIFETKEGEVVVNWDGAILTGTIDKGVITVSWNNYETESSIDTHTLANYSSAESTDIQSITTVTLTPSKEVRGTWEGNITITYSGQSRWEEYDRWDTTSAGFDAGEINDAIFSYLVGYGSNNGDTDDCLQPTCYVDVVESCNGSVAFTATETDMPVEAWENVEGAGQPAGLGGYFY